MNTCMHTPPTPAQRIYRIPEGSQTTLWELLGRILHLSQGKEFAFYYKSDGKPLEEFK